MESFFIKYCNVYSGDDNGLIQIAINIHIKLHILKINVKNQAMNQGCNQVTCIKTQLLDYKYNQKQQLRYLKTVLGYL